MRAATAAATSLIAYAEARAAFARRAREGTFSPADLRRIVMAMDTDWESYLCLEVTDGIVRQAGDLAEFFGLRGFDSLHLASAAALRRRVAMPFRFLCFDDRLQAAAQQVLSL